MRIMFQGVGGFQDVEKDNEQRKSFSSSKDWRSSLGEQGSGSIMVKMMMMILMLMLVMMKMMVVVMMAKKELLFLETLEILSWRTR